VIRRQSRGFQIANSLQKMRNSTHAHFSHPHHFFPVLMGFTYRKSVHLWPFRVNLSKSGLGYSVGGRGFRFGTTARGKNIASPAPYGSRPLGCSSSRLPSSRPAAWFILQHPWDGSWLSQIWRWLSCLTRWHTSRSRHRSLACRCLNLLIAEMPT